MGAFAQLRLLLWKNVLIQWRSPVFTLLEFIVPLLLIGTAFGLMIALAHNYEKAFGVLVYPTWVASGQSFDFIAVAGQGPEYANDSMLELDYLITGKAPKCLFMQVVKNDGDFSYTVNFDIAYSPNTSEKINTIMQMVQERYVKEDLIAELKPLFGPQISGLGNMSIETTCKIFGFADEKALVNFVTDSFANQCNNSLIGGIVFDDKFVNAADDTQELAYKIRLSNTKRRFNAFGQGYQPWDTKLLFSNWPFSGPVDQGFAMGGTPGYWDEGFLTLQRAVDISAAYYLNGLNTTPALLDENYLQLARFPFPSFSTRIIEIGSLFLPTIFVFSLMTSVIYITRSIVMEKENRLKEYTRVMGLSQWIQWVAHFIINYAKILVVVVAATILMHFVSKQTDITITLVFLSLYAFNAVYFSFAISCFMQSGTVATLMAVVGWILLYFWSSFFLSIDLQKPYSFGVRILNCLNPNVALGLGLNMIAQYESQANGLHWNQVQYPSSPDEKITMVHVLVMLLVDGFIFAFITFYVEAVNPTGEGVSQPPWFFVLPSYWCPGHAKRSHEEFDHAQTNGKVDLDAKRNTKIRIVGLTKRYGTGVLKQLIECNFSAKHKKLAVNNLSLDMEEGEITALLGHNGAGKSTTISMLTGVTSPTNGTAFIDGYDIRNSLSLIRKQLGYCPQYNILVNRLTVFEHLEFFCHLKERPWNPEEAMALLRRLQLEDKKDTYAGNLSGGQQRKLSLCISLIGGSEIVIVDEPTSGMDVNARHETWTLLQKEKTDRTILLTTHYMEEADLLGDKIVILAHGEKQCSGTSMELKKQYGSGYQLVVVYKQNDQERLEDVNRKTENLLKEHCSNVVCKSVVGTEAIFLLPEEERPKFSLLFTRLEAQQKQLGITSFGVSVTTMEEVFLRVNDAADEQLEGAEDKSSTSSSTNSESALLRLHQIQTSEANRNGNLFWPHFKAMFIKRILYYRRRWTQFIPQLIVPILYMLLFVWSATQFPAAKNQDPLEITMAPYWSQNTPANMLYYESDFFPDFTNDLNSTLHKWTPDVHIDFSPVDGAEGVKKAILDGITTKGPRTFGLHNPVAFEPGTLFMKPSITGLFNSFCHHSPALAVAAADSILMRMMLNRSFYITITNHPMPPTIADSLKNDQTSQTAGMVIGYALITAMSLVVSGFVSLLIRERKKHFKHMQMMSGLKPWMYWLTAYIWDFIFYLVPAFFILLIFVAFKINVYVDRTETIYILALVLLLFAWTAIPFVYSFSFIFTSAPKGFTLTVMYNVISGMICAIAVPIIRQTSGDHTAHRWELILSAFFPTYNLNNCFFVVYNNEFARIACRKIDCELEMFRLKAPMCCGSPSERSYVDNVLSTMHDHGILFGVLMFAIEGFLFWITTILIENGYFGKFFSLFKCKGRKKSGNENKAFAWTNDFCSPTFTDTDVIEEQNAVAEMPPGRHPVVVKELRKNYGNFEAVKEISFHTTTRSCFGLLGVNGAGKTSTFKMLTGENPITSGDAFINGFSVKNDWRQAAATIGYCPQYDAILKELTGEETLYLIARLRGVREAVIPEVVDAIIETIDIRRHAQRQIKTYSGGNKRRLSLGMALVGMPPVLMLDEPTTGVDPKARRAIWDILAQLRSLGSAIVLTSHSMEECEALCTSLSIMSAGRFRCFGNPQHIKTKYGSGYTLLIKVRGEEDVERARAAILRKFPDSTVKEEHMLQINFELKRTKAQRWSTLFDNMELLCAENGIVDYSLSQTTLEQIFLQFSREVEMTHDLPRTGTFVEIDLNTRF